MIEAVEQLRGSAGPRQVPGAQSRWLTATAGCCLPSPQRSSVRRRYSNLLRTDHIRSSDGTAIAFAEWGNPRGAEVLLVHGWLFSSLALRQLHGELADRCRIVAYDLRGHGDSSAPAGDYGYANGKLWADDLQCVVEATQMRQPVIVGWSTRWPRGHTYGSSMVREILPRSSSFRRVSCSPRARRWPGQRGIGHSVG